ncbi:MAG: hypothetical protein Q8P48_03555, partial [Deltaproteobacteria bacterium]|nr:hypothetical protein [Deltaproteobacteria bacterium]
RPPVAGRSTGRFYDASFIREYGNIESLRAARYNTCYSILLIDIEGAGGGDGSKALYEDIAGAVVASVRSCDIAGGLGERRILVILPETDFFGTLLTIRKLSRSLDPYLSTKALSIIFSHATFPKDGKGFGELLSRAEALVNGKRFSLWEKLNLKDMIFWEIMGELASKSYQGFDNSSFDAGAGMSLPEFIVDQINELIVNEVARSPQKRGILYIASKRISSSLPIIKSLGMAGNVAARVFLVGEAGPDLQEIKNATPVPLNDPRLKEIFFTFFLNEDTGYALVCREGWGGTLSCFHAADPVLVEGLITKFQGEYALGEQLG